MPHQNPVVEAARTAAETASRHADAADAERRLPVQVVDALTEAGFSRRFVPEHLGGEPVSYAELTEAVAAVGEGCASAAWVASLLAHTGRFAAFLPLDGQDEVWEKGPDARLVAGVVPQGTATRIHSGWRVSGTWFFVSGVDHADWALVQGPDPATSGSPARMFAVPRSDFAVTDTWHTLGMRGTGSNALTLDDVFVPEHRSFLHEDLFLGRNAQSGGERTGIPLFAVNGLTFCVPVLGAARGALKLAQSGQLSTKKPPRDSQRVALATAAAEIDAAGLLMERVARTADAGRPQPHLVARSRRDSAHAAHALAGAVDRLFRGNGVRSQDQYDPLQRYWRDTQGAATHGALQFEAAALEYARHLTVTD